MGVVRRLAIPLGAAEAAKNNLHSHELSTAANVAPVISILCLIGLSPFCSQCRT